MLITYIFPFKEFYIGGSMATLVPCKTCGKEISSNATRCPHCGDPVYSFGGPFFISILALIVGLLVALLVYLKM